MLKKITASKTLVAAENYTANDVLTNSASYPGTAAALVWTFDRPALSDGKGGMIIDAHVSFSKTGGITAITPRLALLLFTSLPTSQLYDNYANTGCIAADVSNYVGVILFNSLGNVGGSPETTASPSTFGNLPRSFVCAGDANVLYGILVILDAETNETAGTVTTIDLYIDQDR